VGGDVSGSVEGVVRLSGGESQHREVVSVSVSHGVGKSL
jgi:hypothetical protein